MTEEKSRAIRKALLRSGVRYEDVDDAAQDAWVVFLERKQEVRATEVGFVYGTAKRIAYRYKMKQRLERERSIPALNAEVIEPKRSLLGLIDERELLEQAMQAATPTEQAILTRSLSGISNDEAMAELGLTPTQHRLAKNRGKVKVVREAQRLLGACDAGEARQLLGVCAAVASTEDLMSLAEAAAS